MPTVEQYLSLVTAQHRTAPRFMAMLRALLRPQADTQAFLASLPAAFDLDTAEGAQLDAVGMWVGRDRFVTTPITGVFFSFDDAALGFDQGNWRGPYDAESGLARLDDDSYRTLLRAKIAANQWDGTLAGAAAAYGFVFRDRGTNVFVQDNQDMTITLNVSGNPLSPVLLALLTGGYIPLKPAGVRIAYVNVVSVAGNALFGFDLDNSSVAGFGRGAWGKQPPPAAPAAP